MDYCLDLVTGGVPEAQQLSDLLKLEVRVNSAVTREQVGTRCLRILGAQVG